MGKPTEDSKLVIRGRKISNADIDEVRTLIELQGNQGRAHISRRLAEQWQWKQANGRLKDRACRSILQELSQRGLIQLPVVKSSVSQKEVRPLERPELDTTAIRESIEALLPLRIQAVKDKESARIWRHVTRKYHYLGYQVLVGQNIRHLVYSRERLVAALGWQSAVNHLSCRDFIIGWNSQERRRYLDKVSNNSRFLIMPWVEVKHVASHVLSQSIKQLQSDWAEKYTLKVHKM